MTLRNLVGRSLDEITPSRQTVQRLLASAARTIADARILQISAEGRFIHAYDAIRTLADVGLHVHGYRVLISAPGHHATAIQTLPLTLDIDSPTIVRLDYLRKVRNAAEYGGEEVPESAAAECLKQSEALYAAALRWLQEHRKELV